MMMMMRRTALLLLANVLLFHEEIRARSIVNAYSFVVSLRSGTRSSFGTPRRPSTGRLASPSSATEEQQQQPQAAAAAAVDPVAREQRGDARGASLLLEDVSVYRGPAAILQHISWRVEPRTKWALVGQNGAGKSTLLKAIVGDLSYDGKIVVGTKERVGYLQQTAVAGSQRTVYEEASSGMVELNRARKAMEEAQEKGDWEALERATSRFEGLDGYKQEQKIANVLNGLGFHDFDKRCDELSGGWQMRVAFARALLSDPTLCLFDEPGTYVVGPKVVQKDKLGRAIQLKHSNMSSCLLTHSSYLALK